MNEVTAPSFFNQDILKDKIIALLIHAGISLSIFAGLVLIVRFIWYPDYYYDLMLIQPILITLLLVDVVLGPSLTFVIYKKNKPKLIFDIGVIVFFQLSAFLYGASIIYTERPLYMVYTIDRFVVVTANGVDTDELVYPELKKSLPAIVASDLPENEEERQALMWSSLEGGRDIENLANLYRPMDQVTDKLLRYGIPVMELPEEIIDEIRTRWPDIKNKNAKAYPMVPVKSNDRLLIWDIDNKKMIGLIEKDPWPIIEKYKKVSEKKEKEQ